MARKRKQPRGVAASVVIFDKQTHSFLLIQRKWKPDRGKWAFPGGIMEVDRESIETTAVRELREETGVEITQADLELLTVLSEPKRDPRGHVVDIVYLSILETTPKIQDSDETKTKWFSPKDAAKLPFALGHERVYLEAMTRLNNMLSPS